MNLNEKERLVKQCDALFITHRHEDHAEKEIAEKKFRQIFVVELDWEKLKIKG